MARNPIQFQPGLSLPAFLEQYGTEAQWLPLTCYPRRNRLLLCEGSVCHRGLRKLVGDCRQEPEVRRTGQHLDEVGKAQSLPTIRSILGTISALTSIARR